MKTILKIKNKKGFVILFAVTLSALFLAMALGVSNIALREIKFSTSARDTNDAFFAADTGIECALYHDQFLPRKFPFGRTPDDSQIYCPDAIVVQSSADPSYNEIWYHTFKILGLGSSGKACAIVNIKKDNLDPSDPSVTIISKGYNLGSDVDCFSSSLNLVEREIVVSF